MTTHLVIPDVQVKPGHDYTFLKAIGNYIVKKRPDVIVNIGDFADMPSLSSYDKGKKSFEGRRYKHDIQATHEAMDILLKPLRTLQEKQRRNKDKVYKPRMILTLGNHEHRIKRLLVLEPHLHGSRFGVSFNDLDFNKYYSDVVEYDGGNPGVITIDNIDYSHYFPSGISGRPLQSIHHAYDLTTKRFRSSTVGHSHLLDWHIRRDSSGATRQGLVCGVYQDYVSPWAGTSICNHWTSGIVIKRNVDNGNYDFEHLSIGALRSEYS